MEEASKDATEGRLANVSGAILTGGASSRMGMDKASLKLGGVALATRLAELMSFYFSEVLLVGGDPPAEAPGRRVLDRDSDAPRCALRGLVTALEEADAERVLVLATDLPLMTADLMLGLTAWPEHDAVVVRRNGRPEPLCAIYRRESVLARARAKLESGELALRGLLDVIDTDYLEGADLATLDPEGLALHNLNNPEDLVRAEALLRARGPW